MRKQAKTALLQFFILPLVCVAACSVPDISSVNVTYGEVQWEGSYNESCLREFEVCWSVPSAGAMSCEGVPPNFTSLTIKDVQPCARVTAEVSAIIDGLNDSMVVTAKGEGYAGLPEVLGLEAITSTRNFVWLRWSPLWKYECIDSIHFSICNKAEPHVWSCLMKEMPTNFTTFRLYDYSFTVCHDYYVFGFTASGTKRSELNSVKLYIPSDNKLLGAVVLNITSNSAKLQYWLSIVDYSCTTEHLQMCYSEDSSYSQMTCQGLWMYDINSTGTFQLTGLNSCAVYWTNISVESPEAVSYSNRMTFTTPRDDRRVLGSATATSSDYDVKVTWTTANAEAPCVSGFIVSWNSTADNQTSWRSVGADARSYAIPTSYEPQTVFVEVTALFADGGEESLSMQVFFRGLPNSSTSSSHLTFSTIWLILTVTIPMHLFAINLMSLSSR